MAFDGTLKFDTAIDKTGFQVGIGKIGGIAKAGMAAVTGAVTAAGAGIAAIGKQALDAYGSYEQLVGGVETLFKESANIVQGYAENAFESAGMSANEYMETVTSFSASLLQGLGGDTAKAAEIANTAITDMADNANKMGTDISMIQNAYQGFAKQNFTMLDNLKLGYGGTQAEMARLINDSGVLGDAIEVTAETVKNVPSDKMIEAIHVIQTEMGITGTTAKEAAGTIQGSIAMAGAAWENFLTGLGDENADISGLATELIESVMTAADNIIPVAEAILQSMTDVVTESAPKLVDTALNLITDNLPALIEAGTALVTALVEGMEKNSGKLTAAATDIFTTLTKSALELAPDIIVLGIEFVTALSQGLAESAPKLVESAKDGILKITDCFTDNLPLMLASGIAILEAVGSGILESLPEMVSAAVTAVSEFCSTLLTSENVELLLNAACSILTTVADAIVDNLDELIAVAVQIISFICTEMMTSENQAKMLETAVEILIALTNAIVDNADELFLAAEEIVRTLCEQMTTPDNLAKIIELATELIAELIVGLCELGGKFAGFSTEFFEEIGTALAEIDWAEIGIAIVEGICSGLLGCDFELDRYLKDFGENWLTGIKDIFGIHSPSKLMEDSVGKYLALGIGEGFSEEAVQIGKDITQAVTGWTDTLATTSKNAANDVVQAIEDILDDLPANLTSIGRNLVQGLWNGITGMGSWLRSQISQFANSVLTGFKDAFGIHSPSTVMRDYIGKFLAQGIGVGFTEEIPEIGADAVKAFEMSEPPVIKIKTEIPDVDFPNDSKPKPPRFPAADSGAVQAVRMLRTDEASGITTPSATSPIVNNHYNYSTVNSTKTTQGTTDETVPIHLTATFVVGEDIIADAAVDIVDAEQGAVVTLNRRGITK